MSRDSHETQPTLGMVRRDLSHLGSTCRKARRFCRLFHEEVLPSIELDEPLATAAEMIARHGECAGQRGLKQVALGHNLLTQKEMLRARIALGFARRHDYHARAAREVLETLLDWYSEEVRP